MKKLLITGLLGLGLVFSACGGDGGDSSNNTTPSNTQPIANAGENISAIISDLVTLDGTISNDSDGDNLTFSWALISEPFGSNVSLINSTTVTPSLVPDLAGKYVISLTVNDSTVDSIDDNITITVGDYSTVTSPYTGRIWLDRNLGASQVCISQDDQLCYGDYYQWGRNTDGHEKINSVARNDMLEDKNVLDVGHSYFIKDCAQGYCNWTINEWTINHIDDNGTIRAENWSKPDGTGICPINFRVPTKDELEAETINQSVTNMSGAFDNFLKIPASSFKHQWLGYRYVDYSSGYESSDLWTISIDPEYANTGSAYEPGSFRLSVSPSTASVLGSHRAIGAPVRCIKD